ncbi:MAG TPA: M14 family metallopeptidase [Lacipirellulaceae bacterium]|nr:M14 family metallopeptidase [Lacipirellulaceae bacterium]
MDGIATHVDPHAAQLRRELLAATSFYSSDYFSARDRFLSDSLHSGLEHHSLRIEAPSPADEPLTIDVTVAGAKKPKSALVLSSGVHGVEGLFGSAVQAAFLEQVLTDWQLPAEAAVVLIHAVNPFGFAWRRRFNEDNVDLNRNFLLKHESYAGAPPLAARFRRALNLSRPHSRFGLWTARVVWLALRHGVASFWQTLPVGQYDYPDWLFFGGDAPAQSSQALEQFLPSILGDAEEVAHLDFHTGLGRWAEGQLLVSESEGLENCDWWRENFGPQSVTQVKTFTKSYEVRGGFGPWLRALFPACNYRYATAEFGTYSAMRVIGALADELRWHIELDGPSPEHASRRHLAETFVPHSRSWRTKTLTTALAWVRHAADVLWHRDEFSKPPALPR